MRRHGLKKGKFICIPNGIVEEEWQNVVELNPHHQVTLEKLKKDGFFIIGYFGGHALSNALDILIEVAKRVRDERVRFVLVGDGVEKSRLMKRVKDEHVLNILFMPPVSKPVAGWTSQETAILGSCQ